MVREALKSAFGSAFSSLKSTVINPGSLSGGVKANLRRHLDLSQGNYVVDQSSLGQPGDTSGAFGTRQLAQSMSEVSISVRRTNDLLNSSLVYQRQNTVHLDKITKLLEGQKAMDMVGLLSKFIPGGLGKILGGAALLGGAAIGGTLLYQMFGGTKEENEKQNIEKKEKPPETDDILDDGLDDLDDMENSEDEELSEKPIQTSATPNRDRDPFGLKGRAYAAEERRIKRKETLQKMYHWGVPEGFTSQKEYLRLKGLENNMEKSIEKSAPDIDFKGKIPQHQPTSLVEASETPEIARITNHKPIETNNDLKLKAQEIELKSREFLIETDEFLINGIPLAALLSGGGAVGGGGGGNQGGSRANAGAGNPNANGGSGSNINDSQQTAAREAREAVTRRMSRQRPGGRAGRTLPTPDAFKQGSQPPITAPSFPGLAQARSGESAGSYLPSTGAPLLPGAKPNETNYHPSIANAGKATAVGDTGKPQIAAPNLKSKDGRMLATYDAFKRAGFSDQAARAMVAEVGRENSFRSDLMFGDHSDPHNRARNAGLFSFQKDRYHSFMKHMRDAGHTDASGRLIPSQENLDEQARFIKQEMASKYPQVYRQMMNPNLTYEQANRALGTGYIKWRYNDPRYGHHHGFRDQFYRQITGLAKGRPDVGPGGKPFEPVEATDKKDIWNSVPTPKKPDQPQQSDEEKYKQRFPLLSGAHDTVSGDSFQKIPPNQETKPITEETKPTADKSNPLEINTESPLVRELFERDKAGGGKSTGNSLFQNSIIPKQLKPEVRERLRITVTPKGTSDGGAEMVPVTPDSSSGINTPTEDIQAPKKSEPNASPTEQIPTHKDEDSVADDLPTKAGIDNRTYRRLYPDSPKSPIDTMVI